MSRYQDAFDAHQRARFMRPDAHRWIRPDAARFLMPGTDPASVYPALAQKFRVDQLRVPKGNGEESGRWMDEGRGTGGLTDLVRVAQRRRSITDSEGKPYYNPGGHHELPGEVLRKWNLPPETRQVFENATTGTVPRILLRTDSDGIAQGHFWNGRGGAHGRYNEAVKELSAGFLWDNNIIPERMTPDQAWELLKLIRESSDPRIRDFNAMIRMLRRIYRFRTGRNE